MAVYGIHFDTGEAIILPDSEPILARSRPSNQKLSEQRAAASVSWLAAHGINDSRLMAQGFAETKPVSDSSTEAGRAENRRIEPAKM